MAQALISNESNINLEPTRRHNSRSTLELDMAILKAACTPSRISRIINGTNLHFESVSARLYALEKKGLIHSERIQFKRSGLRPKFRKGKLYTTTMQGHELVHLWVNFQKAYGELIA